MPELLDARGWNAGHGSHFARPAGSGAGPDRLRAWCYDEGGESNCPRAMPIVTVKNRFQVVIPQRVREQVGVAVGDTLEAKVERGRITLTPRPVVDSATAEGLEDVRKGRVRGPFKTVDEMIDSLKGRKRGVSAKAS